MNLVDLESVRELMVEEIQRDIDESRLYHSPRLTNLGWHKYPGLLLEAARVHGDAWLSQQLVGSMKAFEQRRKPKGGFTSAAVPHNANETLAEGEFNRFYIRAVCRRVLDGGGTHVEIYRAKPVSDPRPESRARIGQRLNAAELLADLRVTSNVETALKMPPGPNSGLSVCYAA